MHEVSSMAKGSVLSFLRFTLLGVRLTRTTGDVSDKFKKKNCFIAILKTQYVDFCLTFNFTSFLYEY